MLFKYTAKNTEGERYDGSADVADRFALYAHIKQEGGTVIEIHESSKGFNWFKKLNESFGSVAEHEKIIFTRNLGAMIEAGLSLSRALSVMERQTKNPKLRSVLVGLNSDIKKGTNLHTAIGKFPKIFSSLFVSMIRAGEESGKLSEALNLVGAQLERAYTLKKKVRGALMYPMIIVLAMIVIGILMMIYVVPTLTQTFTELGADLPKSTELIIGVSNFLTQHTILALLIPLLLGVLIFYSARTKRGKRFFNYIVIKIPIIGELVKEVQAARTARTLASLLASGVEIVTAISITSDVIQNVYYKEVLATAQEGVQSGVPLSKAFTENEHLYPILVGEMISVGEETGRLPDMLSRVAEFYESEVDQKTKDMSTIIEPFLMIFIGVGVGFFAISMISPIYSLSENIQ
jgi:type IV pilus assembly protein PilC